MSASPGSSAAAVRRFVFIGQTASASGDFSTEDLPGSSGRLDVALRCVRAALLLSHGLRREVIVYLVLRGGARSPRVLRILGQEVKFLRPDERSLAILVKKSLAVTATGTPGTFNPVRPGISLAEGDLECVLRDAPAATPFLLDEAGHDLRGEALNAPDLLFFVGDHLGVDPATRELIAALGARTVKVGPLSLHSDDVVALVSNELDRRAGAD